ncbi:MAG: acyl-CoA thioesterase [Chlorobi bacterium]|nr:acyl-CoA thioesterase [Chlorobiota bacterium]
MSVGIVRTHPTPSASERAQVIIEKERPLYRHAVRTRVRTYDVDRQGIVHNAVYFYWLEAARVEYFRAIGLPIDRDTFVTKHRFVVAHQEIDYFAAAQFDDEYEVLTRIPLVRRSSLVFDQLVVLVEGQLLVKASAVLVHLNPATNLPERIPDAYRSLIAEFEGEHVVFADESQ